MYGDTEIFRRVQHGYDLEDVTNVLESVFDGDESLSCPVASIVENEELMDKIARHYRDIVDGEYWEYAEAAIVHVLREEGVIHND